MKKFRSVTLAVLALTIMLGFSSCNKGDIPTEGSTDLFGGPEFLAPEVDNSAGEIIGGNFENPIELVGEEADVRLCGDKGRGGNPGMGSGMGNKREFLPMGRILRNLELDQAQIELIKAIMADYRLCVKEKTLLLREKEKELLAPFNEQRRLILTQFKAGEITREEAAAQLKVLNEQVRELMSQSDFRVQACEAMKECRKLMFDQIRATLTAEQQVKWDEWVSKLPEIDCTRKAPDRPKR